MHMNRSNIVKRGSTGRQLAYLENQEFWIMESASALKKKGKEGCFGKKKRRALFPAKQKFLIKQAFIF